MGSNTTETLTQSFFMLASKVIVMLVKVDDVEVLQKRTCKKISLLTRRCRLWIEKLHYAAAACLLLPTSLLPQPSTSILRKN